MVLRKFSSRIYVGHDDHRKEREVLEWWHGNRLPWADQWYSIKENERDFFENLVFLWGMRMSIDNVSSHPLWASSNQCASVSCESEKYVSLVVHGLWWLLSPYVPFWSALAKLESTVMSSRIFWGARLQNIDFETPVLWDCKLPPESFCLAH